MTLFDWQPERYSETRFELNAVSPRHVLVDVDGPRIFLAGDSMTDYLWFACDENDDGHRFLVVPISQTNVLELEYGRTTLYDTLDQPFGWLVDCDIDLNVVKAGRVIPRDLEERLPANGLMLHPDLQPILSFRAKGSEIGKHEVALSVIRKTVDGAYTAIKRLAEVAVGADSRGRPSAALSKVFDLPVQNLAFGSFELSFSDPKRIQPELIEDIQTSTYLKNMSEILQETLDWISAQEKRQDGMIDDLPLEKVQILEKLTPSRDGMIERVEISGSLVYSGLKSVELSRKSGRIIRETMRRTKTGREISITLYGYIREFDKDKMTFILRDSAGNDKATCTFSEDLYDLAWDLFDNDQPIYVIGKIKSKDGEIDVIDFSAEVEIEGDEERSKISDETSDE